MSHAPTEATANLAHISYSVTAFCFHPGSCSSIQKNLQCCPDSSRRSHFLEDALFNIALGARHDILSMRHPHTDLATIWRAMGKIERIAAIKTWLGDLRNQPTIFFVDDLDKLQDEEAIKVALPREAQNYSLLQERSQHQY